MEQRKCKRLEAAFIEPRVFPEVANPARNGSGVGVWNDVPRGGLEEREKDFDSRNREGESIFIPEAKSGLKSGWELAGGAGRRGKFSDASSSEPEHWHPRNIQHAQQYDPAALTFC